MDKNRFVVELGFESHFSGGVMEYRFLGASGFKVSALGFGAGTFGGSGRVSTRGARLTRRKRAAWSTSVSMWV